MRGTRPRRFDAPGRLIPGIAQRILTLQLRFPDHDGVVVRTVHETIPPHVDDALSDFGRRLGPVLDAMSARGPARAPGR